MYFFLEKKLQQGSVIVTSYHISVVAGMYLLKEAYHIAISVVVICFHFFYDSIIISQQHFKLSILSRLLNFVTVIAAIYQTECVTASKKLKGYCSALLMKSIAAIFLH